MADRRWRAVSDFLRTRVGRGDVPAVVAAVTDADGIVYIGGFGKRDVANNTDAAADTIFRMASMTKPVTSLAAMILVSEGRIELDDPVTKYLPDYRQPPVLTVLNADGTYQSRPAHRQILIRHLLTNTSGMSYSFFHPALGRLAESDTLQTELPLLHDPGERWTYGPSTAILARVIATVSGGSLDAFSKARIFDPLGMPDTGYVVPPEQGYRVVTMHQRNASGTLVERPNPVMIQSRGRGDDGLFSTAEDYAAFLRLFLNAGRHGSTCVASDQAIRMMMSNQIGDLSVQLLVATTRSLAKPFPTGAGKDKFGFGFQIETQPSDSEMRSAGSLSWAGVFNTYFWIDPTQNIAAVLLMQLLPGADEKALNLFRGFERLVYLQCRRSSL
jgi:CubicO group peptidase (beta-lactamase class C family)